MLYFAEIENGVVSTVTKTNSPLPNWVMCSDEVSSGWLYEGGVFTPPTLPPEPVPLSITPRQARLKLLEVGLLDELEATIVTNRSWQIEWEYATEVRRDSPLIDAVASQASLTSEQVDAMFLEASQL